MARCARCWVRGSMRAMNVIVNICGVGMIIYSLWLQKMWDDGVALLPSVANLPLPWFIFTCLGIGIAVCFSTLFGHVVANCIGNSSLCIYIITLLSLLFLEATVLVLIFFKMDWAKLISEYIDEHNEQFKVFVVFHLKMCRLIVILILLLQIIVIVFAVILWAVGTGPTTDQTPDVSNLRQSFLVWPSAPALIENSQTCTRCGELQNELINLQQAHPPQHRFRSSTRGRGRSVHSTQMSRTFGNRSRCDYANRSKIEATGALILNPGFVIKENGVLISHRLIGSAMQYVVLNLRVIGGGGSRPIQWNYSGERFLVLWRHP